MLKQESEAPTLERRDKRLGRTGMASGSARRLARPVFARCPDPISSASPPGALTRSTTPSSPPPH